MAISINHATRVIFVPQADLTPLGGPLYQLDVNAFRLALKDLEDDSDGITLPDTHRHNTEVTLAGTTFARTLEIINGFTVEFEDGQYVVSCVGANHNLADVKVANQVSLIINNSAGLQTVVQGSGVTAQDKTDIANEVWDLLIESGLTAKEIVRLLAAVAQGDATGLEGASPVFKSIDGLKDRITATQSGGNRTITGRDAS